MGYRLPGEVVGVAHSVFETAGELALINNVYRILTGTSPQLSIVN
jgi:hypothetical protein